MNSKKDVENVIKGASAKTGVEESKVDTIIKTMVLAVNNGTIGEGITKLNNLFEISKKKAKPDILIDKVAADTSFSREEVKLVINYMFQAVITPAIKKGGVPGLMAMLKYMKPKEERMKEADESYGNYTM